MPAVTTVPPVPTKSGYTDEMFYRSALEAGRAPTGLLLSEDSYNFCYFVPVPTAARTIEIDFRGTPVTIVSYAELPAWLEPVAAAIEQVACLPENWNSYRSMRLQLRAVRRGLVLLERVMSDSTSAPSVHPTADGGIQFEWNTPRMAIEVEVTPEGRALALVEDLSTCEEWEADVTDDSGRLREAVSLA